MKPPGIRSEWPACNNKTSRFFSGLVLLCVLVATIIIKESFPSDNHGNLRPHPTTNDRSLQADESTWIDAVPEQRPHSTTNDRSLQADESSWIDAVPDAVQWILIVFLVCMSAMFSGLTLGLLSLDKTGLEIVMEGEDAKNAAAAKKIYPIRKRGNLLLCTLLLGNVAVNALLSILMAEKAGGLVGFLVSTFVIVIFGEIIPQAVCSR